MRKLLLAISFLLIATNCWGAITFDAVSSGASGAATTLTIAHTIGNGTNRLLVVGVGAEDTVTVGNMVVTGVTYNSVALTKIDGQTYQNYGRIELWYLLEANLPSTGAYNVVVTFTGSAVHTVAGVQSFAGVKQQAPEASANNLQASGGALTCNITTLTNNAWIIDAFHTGLYTATAIAGAGQTEKYDLVTAASGCSLAGSYKPTTTAGLTTTGWTPSDNTNGRRGIMSAAFAEDTGGQAATGYMTTGKYW